MKTKHTKNRYVVRPCDDDNGRTWDVFHGDRCFIQGFKTRAAARAEAAYLNSTNENGSPL